MSNISILNRGKVTFEQVKFTTFSDGAENCTLPEFLKTYTGKVTVDFKVQDCSRDMFRLALVKEALDSLGFDVVDLTMKYIPHGRADRRFDKMNAHPLKVFTKFLNSLNFAKVTVADPHSDVATALIDNVSILSQTDCFKMTLPMIKKVTKDFILCAPDLGATKKIFDTVQAIGHTDYLQAVKIRDVGTGNIVKCDIQCDDLQGKDVIIIDDLTDGGASFKFLAQKLLTKNCGKVILYTTHGIYSKGVGVLEGYVDYIFCYNVMENFITMKDIENFNNKGDK